MPPTHALSGSASDENVWFRPVIPLLLSFIAGIIIALIFPGRWIWILFVAVPSLGIVLHALVFKKNIRLSPLILYVCLGYLAYSACAVGPENPDHVAHYTDGRIRQITGTIDSDPVIQSYRKKCILRRLELSPVSGTSPPFPVRGSIQVNIYGKGSGKNEDFSAGDRITLTGEIRPFRSFRNTGGFDYTRYMVWHDIWGSISASSNKIKRLSSNIGGFAVWMEAIRDNMRGLIHKASAGDAAAILSALIIGDRAGISPGLQDAFNRTGVTHVLSISGLHVGVVATAAFFFFNWILSFSRFLLMRAWTRKGAALAAIFPVVFYGMIAGMPPATQRSVVMIVVFLLTFLVEREHDLFNTIALAALAILITHPPALFSISFQLSFAAVLAIAWGMLTFRDTIYQSALGRNFLIKFVSTLFFVTLFAMIGTTPLVMYYFNLFPVAGLLANLVVVPLMGSLVVIVGLFSVLILYPVSAQFALWGLQLCDAVLKPAISFVKVLSQMEWSAIYTITPSILEMACYYLLVSGAVLLKMRKKDSNRPDSPQPGNPAYGRWVGFMMILVIGVLLVDGAYWTFRRLLHEDFRATVLDVGQGNSALLEFPKGYCAVIDGGGFSDNAVFDTGGMVLAPYLWRNKIRTVDTVILTHPDADHLNGLIYILKHFHVKQVISTHQPADSESYREFLSLIRTHNIRHPDLNGMGKTISKNGITLQFLYPFLHPSGNAPTTARIQDSPDANNHSLVIRAGFGKFSILFPGDIEEAGETAILAAAPEELPSTILIAPHHGSKTSSSPAFLDAVNPEAVIISSGKPDRFPSLLVLDRYRHKKYQVFRTDENGAVRIVTDGKGMAITPMKGDTIWKDL
ncbi:MAG: DNA internalization-related competence protein ComEC/Rec2 [Desulfosalsimonadaceae bacterium]|nr:DNA internalization-related competence protein ComEC/Rec2 [Desulfosalsimonadaceae bacterium]